MLADSNEEAAKARVQTVGLRSGWIPTLMVSVSQLRLKGVSMVTKLISVGIQPDLRPTV